MYATALKVVLFSVHNWGPDYSCDDDI